MANYVRDFESIVRSLCRQGGGRVDLQNQPMPAGANPPAASVTIEVNVGSYVGLRLGAPVEAANVDDLVRHWMRHQEARFETPADAARWVRQFLRPAYGIVVEPQSVARPQPPQLTDLEAVATLRAARAREQRATLEAADVARILRDAVFGQEHIMDNLAGAIARHCVRVQPRRPLTCWFAGPTGVGKTRTAQMIADTLNQLCPRSNQWGYTRLDMAEYGESHRRSQLIGSPQGYVGHGEGAQLTDALAENPRRVVLFDEIEKAHPLILQTLMNTLDAGRLATPARNSSGSHEIDCRKAIFVFTSNAEADRLIDEVNREGAFHDFAATDRICRLRLRAAGIAPEIIGRITIFALFRPLTERAQALVVAQAVRDIGREYGLDVRFVAPPVVSAILDHTATHDFGARPYEYAVDQLIGPLFAEWSADRSRAITVVEGNPARLVPATSESAPGEPRSVDDSDSHDNPLR